jgi:hypothetical protein
VLIDPTRKSDVDLIDFGDGGIAVPAPGRDEWDRERAEKSINRYKLNEHAPLRRAREEVWNRCKQKADEFEILIYQQRDAEKVGKHSPTRKQKIETLAREIKEMTLPTAEFSATARAFVLQDPRPFIRKLIA